MRTALAPRFVILLLSLVVPAALAAPVEPVQIEPVRVSADIAGDRAVVEVRDLPEVEAKAAIRLAIERLAAVDALLAADGPDSVVGRLNAAAGAGPQPIDAEVDRLLRSAASFCLWSRGALGPLGGSLYETWENASLPPAPNSLARGARSAACENLTLQPESPTVSIAAGSRLDLRHFATGYAVDRAAEALNEIGVTNAWVEFRSVTRAMGGGPDGRGWQVTLPILPGMTETLDPIFLRDQALAVVSTHRSRFRFGEVSYPPFLDQRSGQPASGTVGVMVVTGLALDAQAVGSTLVVLGNREGQLRLGGVIPSPSVLWLLGEIGSPPLIASFRWTEVATR